MNSRRLPGFLIAAVAASALPTRAGTYTANVPEGETTTIDAAFVAALGADDLVKTGRGTLVSSADMAAYTGTITIREGAFKVTTTGDLGTADGGTVVEDGGTLLVDMASGQERFPNEPFTIAGTGDAAYGAAVYQATGKSNRFKIFQNLTLSGDTTVFSGTHLGVDAGTVAMNGHTLTVKGANFTFRNDSFPAPVGNIVTEANLVFMNGSGTIGDPSKTLTVRNGERAKVSIADNTMNVVWRLVVEEGGRFEGSPTTPKHWGGDVVWNATTDNGVSGLVAFDGELTGTGVVKIGSGTLTLANPPEDTVGLSASGTASVEMPHPKAYSYAHKGLITCYRSDGWRAGLNNSSRTDNRWGYCAYGPGPQLEREGWWESRNGKKDLWNARGYLWNREATNVTYTISCGPVYETWINTGGTLVRNNNNWVFEGDRTARYDNKRDSWGSFSLEVPANSCIGIDIQTVDGGNSDANDEGGPRNDNDKFKINGVIANDPTGWFFTTNAVSSVENPAAVTSLALAGDGAIDMNGMPLSVAVLSGAGLVTNVTALTVSDSWTLAAEDIADGASLVVDGNVVFGNGCALSVTDLRSLPVAQTFTICKADLITGLASGARIEDGGREWKFVLSGDGTALSIENIPHATVLYLR